MPELLLFDCDGVLVDSERISNEIFAQMLRELGLDVDLQYMFDHFVGYSMEQCVEKIEALTGEPLSADFAAEFERREIDALSSQLVSVDGVREALSQIDMRRCVVSSGSHKKIRNSLTKTGLMKFFEPHIFSVEDVAKPKPAPDVYQFAARTMKIEPEKCLVIEDTPTGVAAGAAAGMTVFGYAGYMKPEKLTDAGAHHVVSNMAQLPQEMERFFA